MTEEYEVLKRLKDLQEILDCLGYDHIEPVEYIWNYFTKDNRDVFPESIVDWDYI